MELVKLTNNELALEPQESEYIADLLERYNTINDELNNIKASLLTMMEQKGIKKLENDALVITYIAETYRESFNSRAFRKDHEELYNDYIEMSTVKPSVRIKLK